MGVKVTIRLREFSVADQTKIPEDLKLKIQFADKFGDVGGIVTKSRVGIFLFLVVLVGCAKSPASIEAAYVSHVPYQSWNCKQLGEENHRLATALATASQTQENARTGDIVGIILIGLPVSSLSGDNIAPQIAHLKGEIEAVRKAALLRNCDLPPVEVAPPPPPQPAAQNFSRDRFETR